MTIEEIKSIIVGKWKYEDGRILTFSSGSEFTLTTKDGKFTTPAQPIFFKNQENGIITLAMPVIAENLGVIKSIDKERIVYDSLNTDSSKVEMVLTRL